MTEDIASQAPAGATHFNFQTTTKHTRAHRTWFRGEHTNYNPDAARMIGVDAAEKWVLQGWLPDAPLITPDTQITAFGSCFAANISNWLSRRNFRVLNKGDAAKNAYVVTCGEGMVNSFVIRQQFEWAWEGRVFDQPLWHGYKAEEFGYDPEIRRQTRDLFDSTDLFILTFGLSEVWYDDPTGAVFWRTIPKDAYDPARHRFRVSSVEENRENMLAIYQLIRKHRPDAKIIFTLSPIPLIATFRDKSCLTANSVSKSVLRVAIDEAMRAVEGEGRLFYWPSYELVTDVFRSPYRDDRRHPKAPVLDYIMTLFEHVWCADSGAPKPSLTEAWVRAQAAAGLLPGRLTRICNHRKAGALREMAEGGPLASDAKADKALRALYSRLADEFEAEAAG